jgi:hypothetical protein
MELINNDQFTGGYFNILYKNNIDNFDEFIILSNLMKEKTSTNIISNTKILNNTSKFLINIKNITNNKLKFLKKQMIKSRDLKIIYMKITKDFSSNYKKNIKIFSNLTNNLQEININNETQIILKYHYLTNNIKTFINNSHVQEYNYKRKTITFPNSIELMQFEESSFILPYKTKYLSCFKISFLKNRTNNLKFLNTVAVNVNKYQNNKKYDFNNLSVLNISKDHHGMKNTIGYNSTTVITNIDNFDFKNTTKNIIFFCFLFGHKQPEIKLKYNINSLCLVNTDEYNRRTDFNLKFVNSVNKCIFFELINFNLSKNDLDSIGCFSKITSIINNPNKNKVGFVNCSDGMYFTESFFIEHNKILCKSQHHNKTTINSNLLIYKQILSEYVK